MFEAMHDLADIPVSLYFPGDVQMAVDILADRFEIVEGPNHKDSITRDFQKIRKLVEEQRQCQKAAKEGKGDFGNVSPDVVRMLGLINGIVMTGEVALQQLASISAAETTRELEDRTQKAMGPRYMAPWLDKYFMDRKRAFAIQPQLEVY